MGKDAGQSLLLLLVYMSKYVRRFVENCMTCNVSRPPVGKVHAELHPIPKIEIPWHTIHIDIKN